MANSEPKALLIILGNQLFPLTYLSEHRHASVFMAEDLGLCTYVRHHQQKIVLFLAAMRAYRDELNQQGFSVTYHELDLDAVVQDAGAASYEDRLQTVVQRDGIEELRVFEIEDKPMEQRLQTFADEQGLRLRVMQSPMFLCSRQRFADYLNDATRPFMAGFYKQERRRLGILMQDNDEPVGGRWSYDEDNRKKLPKTIQPPAMRAPVHDEHVAAVTEIVRTGFANHPGSVDEFWWPTTHAGALAWLEEFLVQRFANFGPYEDAMTVRSATVFHSVLSPLLNIGLLTPDKVIDEALQFAEANDVPLPSVEGFVRQIIGWREFIRGIYRHHSEEQENLNHWQHERQLTDDWYAGTTGIPPLDDTITTAQELGWTHHIPRLMIVANLMTLCEIHPRNAWRWFMEMYVDSSEWVMGPNVYGMGLYSDGGIFATKPYICGSNYLRKMSDYPKGDWCDVVDGLYWRFIATHRDFFESQPRLSLMPKAFDRLTDERRERIFLAADDFLARYTKSL